MAINEWINKIANDPLNASFHLQYANFASKNHMPYLAYAELKTAYFLGGNQEQKENQKSEYFKALPNRIELSHNHYARNVSLASEIISKAMSDKITPSILDVGGGQGHLAAFLPENYKYCLAEPSINGISGLNLPFPDHSFDYVVSCHVLEHIPLGNREYPNERSMLIYELTRGEWAKEHLECIFPQIDDIKGYAKKCGLDFNVKPNGNLTTGFACVFVDYFANQAGLQNDWKKLNSFFNEKYTNVFDQGNNFSAYLIYLRQR
ncbi:MAG: class I SAM-dependent methyltransferase [Sedimentisphaerales bacterium]